MGVWFDDLPLDFTRDDTRQAEQLLITGYSDNFAALGLATNAGLNKALLNQMAPIQYLIREIMVNARLAARMPELLAVVLGDPNRSEIRDRMSQLLAGHEDTIRAAALQRQPSIETLALLPSTLHVWAPEDRSATPLTASAFEKIINAAAGFAEPASFRRRLAEAEVRTARIDIGGKAKGTGFLVGAELLLTNWHVVKGGTAGAVAVFDHGAGQDGAEAAPGRVVPFATEWSVASSKHDAVPVEVGEAGPLPGMWDFAVVRLAEPVGSQRIGAQRTLEKAEVRGHYLLDGTPYEFEPAEPILILGHPRGRPIQLSYASPSDVRPTTNHNRVRYKTNTEGGSSGSPVFNRDWRVVALHQAAGPTSVADEFNLQNAQFNQGIPITGIVTTLREQLAGRPELAELHLA